MKISKTNVARLLDKEKIPYELIPYEVDEADLSAVHVAQGLGEDPHQVFKTLVLQGTRRFRAERHRAYPMRRSHRDTNRTPAYRTP